LETAVLWDQLSGTDAAGGLQLLRMRSHTHNARQLCRHRFTDL
jgi:hypothetical protein